MSKYIIAMYDKDDYPYMIFESHKEAAKFLNTTRDSLKCTISRKQKKKFKGNYYMLYKINLDASDIRLSKYKNIFIGAILEVLNI